MKLKQNQTTQKCTDSVIQSKLKHTSVRIPACTSATGELPCQLSRVNTFNICLLLRGRAICLTHRAGRWKRIHIPKEHEAGTVESALQSSRLCMHQFLVLHYSFKAHSVTLGPSLPMQRLQNRTTPPLPHPLVWAQWCKNPKQWKIIGQQKIPPHSTIKRNNAALIFLESFIVWNISCNVWPQFLFLLITIELPFPPTEAFNRAQDIRKDWDVLCLLLGSAASGALLISWKFFVCFPTVKTKSFKAVSSKATLIASPNSNKSAYQYNERRQM